MLSRRLGLPNQLPYRRVQMLSSTSHSKFIAQVPAHLIRQAVPKKLGRVWRADFNIATWLHLAGIGEQLVTLKISYQDAGHLREQLLDRGRAAINQRILLCGVARLEFSQSLEGMSLSLLSEQPIPSLTVDELFVQAVDLRDVGEIHRRRR